MNALKGGRIKVLVTPSELRLAPKSTGLTRVTLRCPQCSPSWSRSSLCEVDGPAGGSDGLVGGVEQDDGDEFARLDQFIGAAVDQFVEHRLEAFLGNRSPEAHAADDGAEGVGDVFGPVAQVGLGGLPDAKVFLSLPAQDQHPDGREKAVNQQAAAGQFHALCRVAS